MDYIGGCHSIFMQYEFQHFILCDLYCVDILYGTISIYFYSILNTGIYERIIWFSCQFICDPIFDFIESTKILNDLPKHFTCSLNRKVSSRVKPKYWNDLTLLIVISLVTISPSCFGIGLFVAWNNMKLVLSQFIVNLFLTHHNYNSLNFDTAFDIRLFKFSSYVNRAISSANSLKHSCLTSR